MSRFKDFQEAHFEDTAQAFECFQAGQLTRAEQLYRQILQRQSDQSDALHWLGVIVYQTGRPEEAFIYWQQAIALNPNDANLHNSLGAALMEQGNLEQAADHLQQAIALNPNHVFAYSNLANLLLNQGNVEGAITHFQQVMVLNPNDADAHNSLGTILHQQNRLEEAAAYYRKAISLQSDNIIAMTNLGNLLRSQGNLDEALRNLRSAFTLNPNYVPIHNGLGLAYLEQGNLVMAVAHLQQAIALQELAGNTSSSQDADAHYNLGLALKAQGKLEEAVASYRKAIALNADHVFALTSLAEVLREQDQFDEAMLHLRKALTLDPDSPAIYTSLGLTSHEQGNLEAAIAYLNKVVESNPEDAYAHSNLAAVLWTQGQVEAAIASYQTAIQLKPDYAEAHLCLSQSLIVIGDWQNGFAEYEWRWRTKDWAPLSFPQPVWDGSRLTGETILLHTEGGFGDIIQFIRYAPLVSEKGGQVVVSCPASLQLLLATVAGIQQIVVSGEDLPEFQIHVPLLSLPHLLKTTLENVPAQIPYVTPPKSGLKLELFPGTQFKVGIVWATGYNPRRDLLKNHQTRSAAITAFSQFLDIPGISFYSLQVGHNAADINQLDKKYRIQDLSSEVKDFADTAALVAQMDLVISVDTAVIHLAGALGKPVWVLLSRPHDWRWLLDREDTPWYPTMRLFRQTTSGDWAGAIDRVTQELKRWVTLPKN
jgi:tetratricopeptide (TPR) repeat protein